MLLAILDTIFKSFEEHQNTRESRIFMTTAPQDEANNISKTYLLSCPYCHIELKVNSKVSGKSSSYHVSYP